jgi:hypothetical protein
LPGVILVLVADSIGKSVGQQGDPDLITVALLVVVLIDSTVLSRVLLGQKRLETARAAMAERGRDSSLVGVGKVASVLAASLTMTPLLIGFVLLVISGDSWRLYLFAAVSVLAGFYFWRRVEEGLRQLAATPPEESQIA